MRHTLIVITTTKCVSPFYLESGTLLDYPSHFAYPLEVKHILQGFIIETCSTLLSHGGMSLTISPCSSDLSLSFNHPKSTTNTTNLRFIIQQFILCSFISRLQDLIALAFFSYYSLLGNIITIILTMKLPPNPQPPMEISPTNDYYT